MFFFLLFAIIFFMKIYLATGNKNKKREMQQLLPEHEILIPSDEGIAFDPEETGSTFYENSLIKAKALFDIVHQPVIADDSGICVDALEGAPGIYSSRYAGPDFMHGKPDGTKISQEEQNVFLISQLNDAVKKRLHYYNKRYGLKISEKKIDTIDFKLEKENCKVNDYFCVIGCKFS